MIVRERGDGFVCIPQHDHALLSGGLVAAWSDRAAASGTAPSASLCLATTLHDVGWQGVDRHPPWNASAERPYTFQDLPASLKLPMYQRGVDRVEEDDAYAALLCSRHYVSFIAPRAGEGPELTAYVRAEEARQERLIAGLPSFDPPMARRDLALLQLCDNLSLYVALNEPGATKEEEHPWYRDGFPPLGRAEGDPLGLQARWLDRLRVALAPFPLRDELVGVLPNRFVSRESIGAHGWSTAYQRAEEQVQVVRFVPDA